MAMLYGYVPFNQKTGKPMPRLLKNGLSMMTDKEKVREKFDGEFPDFVTNMEEPEPRMMWQAGTRVPVPNDGPYEVDWYYNQKFKARLDIKELERSTYGRRTVQLVCQETKRLLPMRTIDFFAGLQDKKLDVDQGVAVGEFIFYFLYGYINIKCYNGEKT